MFPSAVVALEHVLTHILFESCANNGVQSVTHKKLEVFPKYPEGHEVIHYIVG